MKKVKINVPAKVNLTLDVLGVLGNYHNIKSLVASIDVFDVVTLTERRDGIITLDIKGYPVDCPQEDNNAVKAARLFCEKFSTYGVDIRIKKGIPVGGGLGGSSADIAGVLLGMKEIYHVEDDIVPLANALGSDSGYMVGGGYAVISGRGDNVEKVDIDEVLYLLLIADDGFISARSCYGMFDQLNINYPPCTDEAVNALKESDVKSFFKIAKNDLYHASEKIVPDIKINAGTLKIAGAEGVLMTGSGPTVYAVFNSEEKRNEAYKKLSPLFGARLIKAKTLIDPFEKKGQVEEK